jgi:hypothetical protein
MVRMGMGDDDKLYLLRGEPILFHLVKDLLQVAGMARIYKNGHLPLNHISVAIVFIGIPPEVGIDVFLKFHKIELPFRLSINDQEGSCQPFDSPAQSFDSAQDKLLGLPFDKFKAPSKAEGLWVDPERRFPSPSSKARSGAAEWVKLKVEV